MTENELISINLKLCANEIELIANSLVRAMIPHVRYSSDDLAMAHEASAAQSYEAKRVLSFLLDAGVFDDMRLFVESAISEYMSMQR